MPSIETASPFTDDPLLASALNDMESAGVNLSDPVTDSPEDVSTPAGAPVETPAPATPSPSAPSGDVAAPAAASPSETPADLPDPLAGTEPFTYTVNGETRTMPHVYRVPGEGIMVEEAAVPQFQLMASRAESLEKANQDLYQQTQQLERLSAWTVKDEQGHSTTLTGREAFEARAMDHVAKDVALQQITHALLDPKTFASLVGLDADGNIALNKAALEGIVTRSELAELRATQQMRQQLTTLSSQPVQAPAMDLAQAAPVIVQHYATKLNATALTTDDKTMLHAAVPRYIRPATQQDVASDASITLGSPVIDASFEQLITHTQALRAQTASAAKAAGDAATFNAAQKQGVRAPVAPAKPVNSPAPTPGPSRSKAAVWDDVFSQAMSEIG